MSNINTTNSSSFLESNKGMHYETHCADRLKILWWDGTGLCLYAKRLERGRFVWPLTREGAVSLTPAQLSMLCEGIDWRLPVRTDARRDAPMRAG
jgi:transposase